MVSSMLETCFSRGGASLPTDDCRPFMSMKCTFTSLVAGWKSNMASLELGCALAYLLNSESSHLK